MQDFISFELSFENCIKLDRLIRTTKTEHIIFDSSSAEEMESSLTIYLITPDFSHFTTISLESKFFINFSGKNQIASIPFTAFYRKGMKNLLVKQNQKFTELIYTFEGASFKKIIQNSFKEPFEIDFVCRSTVRIDMICLRNILRKIKSKTVKISIFEKIKIEEPGSVSVIEINKRASESEIKLSLNKLMAKNILGICDMFSDCCLAISDLNQPIQWIFREGEVYFNSFMSTE